MKKSILMLALIFTISTAIFSCREVKENEIEMRDDVDDLDDLGDEIERGAEEVEREIEKN